MSDKLSMHPQFRSKEVFFLDCRHCESNVCRRAMESVLVADSQTKLFSTDCPEKRFDLCYRPKDSYHGYCVIDPVIFKCLNSKLIRTIEIMIIHTFYNAIHMLLDCYN